MPDPDWLKCIWTHNVAGKRKLNSYVILSNTYSMCG